MYLKNRKAFTMLELVFVIVIIGVLSAIAIPKFAATANLAQMSKGKSVLAMVRSALATEKQKNILKGTYADLVIHNKSGRIFTSFTDSNGSRILDNDLPRCTDLGCWNVDSLGTYTFYREATSNCTYKLESNRFVDKTTGGCTELEN
jgi:general secretion pathway protein G